MDMPPPPHHYPPPHHHQGRLPPPLPRHADYPPQLLSRSGRERERERERERARDRSRDRRERDRDRRLVSYSTSFVFIFMIWWFWHWLNDIVWVYLYVYIRSWLVLDNMFTIKESNHHMWCDLGQSVRSRTCDIFTIWLKSSLGWLHFAETPTWVGQVVPKL